MDHLVNEELLIKMADDIWAIAKEIKTNAFNENEDLKTVVIEEGENLKTITGCLYDIVQGRDCSWYYKVLNKEKS